ncbi:hypothetical protein [Larkinella rosea]|uniref:Lipoprotein n=1 Tax=Larkinella rosea TaxID=2025312 RepID=A0A3P1BV34_9BACT|nr:hypothetical protein [Larkinella rosea]RRB04975.1 hypothetical protein EHT25_11530 [Larkinella rosea]
MNRTFSLLSFLPFSFLLLFFASSCNPERTQNTKALAQEMNDHKIKRVTDAQLTTTVDEWGKSLVLIARKTLTSQLNKTAGDPALCTLKALPAIQKAEAKYAVTIDLLSAKDTANPVLNTKERELLGAYVYNAENKLEQTDNIQKLNDTLLVYNSPVPTGDLICKTCADNAALPFVVWRIVFSKREVIRRIDPKKLH